MKKNYLNSRAAFFLATIFPALLLVSCSTTGSNPSTNVTTAEPPTITPAVAIPGCSPEEENVSVQAYCLFTSASLLLSEGFIDQAKLEFLEVISLDNQRVEAYILLGDIFLEENNLQQAEAMYLSSIELDAKNSLPFYNLGVVYDKSGIPEQAIKYYLESIRLNPRGAKAHYSLGLAYSRNLDLIDSTIAELHKAIELDPTLAVAHYDLGQVYEYLSKPTLAVQHYEIAQALGNTEAVAKLRLIE